MPDEARSTPDPSMPLPGGGSQGTVTHLSDYSGDCRTLSVERLLEQALDLVRRAQADGWPLRPLRAAVVIRWSDGDVGETEVRAAGVDLMGLLGLLRLGSLAVERMSTEDEDHA